MKTKSMKTKFGFFLNAGILAASLSLSIPVTYAEDQGSACDLTVAAQNEAIQKEYSWKGDCKESSGFSDAMNECEKDRGKNPAETSQYVCRNVHTVTGYYSVGGQDCTKDRGYVRLYKVAPLTMAEVIQAKCQALAKCAQNANDVAVILQFRTAAQSFGCQ